MAQIKLKNNTGTLSKIGQLVRMNPVNINAYIPVTDLSTLPVIGAVASVVPSGNSALINLIGGYSTNPGTLVIVSPTAPVLPAIGTIWIDSSGI